MNERGVVKDFRYIYNPKQAQFYIENHIELVETGVCKGDVYFKFKDSETLQNCFKQWVLRKANK